MKIIYLYKFERFQHSFHFSSQLLFDFENRCPDCLHGAFLEKWPSYGPQLKQILMSQYKKQVFTTGWPPKTESLFILLRLLPAKPGARISVAVFKESIEKLIVFRKVFLYYFIY